MSSSRIAEAIKSAREYLRAHTDEARYRDSIASAVVVEGIRVTGTNGSSLVDGGARSSGRDVSA